MLHRASSGKLSPPADKLWSCIRPRGLLARCCAPRASWLAPGLLAYSSADVSAGPAGPQVLELGTGCSNACPTDADSWQAGGLDRCSSACQ